jgi:hypothetical protein
VGSLKKRDKFASLGPIPSRPVQALVYIQLSCKMGLARIIHYVKMGLGLAQLRRAAGRKRRRRKLREAL